MSAHTFVKRPGGGGCARCGYIRANEAQHGHSCIGKMLDVPGRMQARCYDCGRTVARSDTPITVRAYRR